MAIMLSTGLATVAVGQSTDPAVFVRTYPNAAQGYVSSLTIAPDGAPALVAAYPTADTGAQAIALSPDGHFVAVAHGTANTIEEAIDIFGVNPDASLVHLYSGFVPNSPLSMEWLNRNTLAVTKTSLSGANSVGVYRWDAIAQTLTEIDREDSGSFNSEILRHPHGRFLVANDTTQNVIRVFEILENGELDSVWTQPTGGLYQFGFGFNELGTALYAGCGISSGSSKAIGYAFDLTTGQLDPLPGSPYTSPGSAPNEVDVEETGSWAFMSHGSDATLRSFSVQPDGSLVSANFAFDVGMQGSLGEADTLGSRLYVTDNTTAADGKSGIYAFEIDPTNGRFSMIGTDLVSTGSSTPDGFDLWNPAEGIYLETTTLQRGEDATIRLTNCTPDELVGLAYSVSGPARVFVPRIGATIGLDDAVLFDTTRANENGVATWSVTVPSNAPNHVWLQAAQIGRVSNVLQRRVN